MCQALNAKLMTAVQLDGAASWRPGTTAHGRPSCEIRDTLGIECQTCDRNPASRNFLLSFRAARHLQMAQKRASMEMRLNLSNAKSRYAHLYIGASRLKKLEIEDSLQKIEKYFRASFHKQTMNLCNASQSTSCAITLQITSHN